MREQEVAKRAFAMPLTSPSYPPGPYRFRILDCATKQLEATNSPFRQPEPRANTLLGRRSVRD